MMVMEQYFDGEEVHPIDIVQRLATHQAWEYDRLGDDQISMSVEGQWRNYAITLAWSERDETLRLICTFEMEPPEHRMPALYETLNSVNDNLWAGGFSYWADHGVMVFRYALILHGGQIASIDQIDGMIGGAVKAAERYYPAFQLVTWGERDPAAAMQVAIAEAYGHA